MLDFATSFLTWLASTAIPAFVGLVVMTGAGRVVKPRYLAAFSFGIFLWFFVDTIGGSANLDVNLGFSGGLNQFAVILLFVVGAVLLLLADGDTFSREVAGQKLDLRIPILVAIAVGVHGFSEGTAFGSTAATTSGTSLLQAFGGVSAGVAYVLHKTLEPMMIGACYVAYSWGGRKTTAWLKDLLVLTALFVVPSLVGAATGYYIGYDATYLFALGTGTSAYAALRLAKPLFSGPDNLTDYDSAKIGLCLVFGFLCIYLAALFHS